MIVKKIVIYEPGDILDITGLLSQRERVTLPDFRRCLVVDARVIKGVQNYSIVTSYNRHYTVTEAELETAKFLGHTDISLLKGGEEDEGLCNRSGNSKSPGGQRRSGIDADVQGKKRD